MASVLNAAEWYVLFTWSFVLSTTLYCVLAAKYESYSGWLWYSLAQTLVVSLTIATTKAFPEHVAKLSNHSVITKYFRGFLYGSEALQSVALGILVERYHAHSEAFDWYFVILILIKVVVYAFAGFVERSPPSPSSSAAASSSSSSFAHFLF